MTARRICLGTGQPGVEGDDPSTRIYPHCPVCGREMAAQGRKAMRRFEDAWQSTPRHFVVAEAPPAVAPEPRERRIRTRSATTAARKRSPRFDYRPRS